MNDLNSSTKPTPSTKTWSYIFWKYLPQLVLVLLLVIIAVLSLVVKQRKYAMEEAKKNFHILEKPLVNTAALELRPRSMIDAINLPGTIEPWTQLELKAKVSGAIEDVLVKEGDTIRVGQVIARIEEDDYRIAVEAAHAAYALARSDYARSQSMHKSKVVAKANLEAASAHLQATKAELDRAKLQLSRCTITAPMNGVIKHLDAKIGFYLSVGDPLAELLDIDRVKAVVGIPESDVDAVKKITSVELELPALGGKKIVGKSHFLAPSPESTAHLFRFEIALNNANHAILPGMFFRSRIVKRQIEHAIAVPLYAIISRDNEQYVFVVDGDKARKQPVSLGVIEQWQVQVTRGLSSGEQILVEGHREVEDGQKIKLIRVVTDPELLLP